MRRWLWFWGLLASVWVASAQPTTTLYVQFIRGTHEAKPAEKSWKPIGPVLRERLEPIWRWPYYWEIRREAVKVAEHKTSSATLNPEFSLQIEWLADKKREIRLYRKGQLARRERGTLDSLSILGGDRESGESWFIVVRSDEPGNYGHKTPLEEPGQAAF
jgi:hypothetical protein